MHSRRACLLGLLIALSQFLLTADSTVLNVAGSDDGSNAYGTKLSSAVSSGASKSVDIKFRAVPGNQQAHDEFSGGTAGKGALSSQPITTSSVINIPVAFSTLSIYVNIPGTSKQLNLTACTLARIFTGDIVSWQKPDITDDNPGLAKVLNDLGDEEIKVISHDDSPREEAETTALKAFLATACPSRWTGSIAAFTKTNDAVKEITFTPWSIGYALTMEGSRFGLNEAGIKNKNNQFVTALKADKQNTTAAVKGVLPSSFADGTNFNGVYESTWLMEGQGVFPITQVHYLHLPTDASTSAWNQDGEGELMQAIAKFAVSPDGYKVTNGTGLIALEDEDIRSRATSALDTITLSTTEYTLEGSGVYLPTLSQPSISANQEDYVLTQITQLQQRAERMEEAMQTRTSQVLRGTGSSAVSVLMWRMMAGFMASASSPVWLTYRAIGSGGGQAEFVARDYGYDPANDFGASDVPLPSADWSELKDNNIEVVQLPIGLAPMNFFVSVPKGDLPNGKMKLSPCTITAIYSGSITSWSDSAIAEDVGASLPDKPIKFLYRDGSGTTAVISSYMKKACPDKLKFTAGKTVPEWANMETGLLVGTTADMIAKMEETPYVIGYMDAGAGSAVASLVEVSLQNKAGSFLTSGESDVPAAAQELFNNGWPSSPKDDFSSVSLLDQPGEKTWPISAMPMIFVRTNAVSLGATGSLLLAFLQYLFLPKTQAGFKIEGFEPLPQDILDYSINKALPLVIRDPRYPTWFYEADRTNFGGAGPFVFSTKSITSNYERVTLSRFRADIAALQGGSLDRSEFNVSEIVGENKENFSVDEEKIKKLDERIEQLESLAIAGMVFGIAGAAIAIFTIFRSLARGVVSKDLLSAATASSGGLRRKSSDAQMNSQNEEKALMV